MPGTMISEETQLNAIYVLIGTREDVLPKMCKDYIYIYRCVCVCVYVYIYIYIIFNMPAYDSYLLMMSFHSKS